MSMILENYLEKVDSNGWYIGLLYKILSFRSQPNVTIQKGYDKFTRVNTIEKPIINTKVWNVHVQ